MNTLQKIGLGIGALTLSTLPFFMRENAQEEFSPDPHRDTYKTNQSEPEKETVHSMRDIDILGNPDLLLTDRLNNILKEMTPRMHNSISSIHVYSPEQWDSQMVATGLAETTPTHGKVGAYANLRTSTIHIPLTASEEEVYHEAAHLLTRQITRGNRIHDISSVYHMKREGGISIDYWFSLDGKIINSYDEGCEIELNAYDKEHCLKLNATQRQQLCSEVLKIHIAKEQEGFETEWRAIVGEEYGKRIDSEQGRKGACWAVANNEHGELLGSYEPAFGFFTPYGANNFSEDVATAAAYINTTDTFDTSLITPGSNKYNPKYGQKIDLLKKYGFVREQKNSGGTQ